MSEASSSNPDPFSVTQQFIVSDWGPRNTSAQNISFDIMALLPTFDLGLMQSEGTHCSVFGQIPRLSCLSNGSFLEAISSSADSGGQGFENHDGSTNLLPSTDDQKAVMEELNPKKRKSRQDSDNLDSFPSSRKFKKIKCTEQKNLSPECLEDIIVNKDKQIKNSAVISAKQKLKQAEVREDYVHVRAKRGQATNSHSLAERVRREKINERMRFLQNLIPGCSKITGKAVVLGEIINYVQSLQNQVEFLSMKLATAIPELNFDTKQIFHSGFGNSSAVMCDTATNTFNPHLDGFFIPQSVMEPAIAVDREPNPPLLLKTALPHISQLPQGQRSWEDDDEFRPLFETCFSPNMNANGKELPGIYEDEAI